MPEQQPPSAEAPAQGSADDQWYYTARGQRVGPVGLQALRDAASSGQLTGADMVWRPGMANWAPASQVPEVGLAAGPPGAGGGWGAPPAAQKPVTFETVIGYAICAAVAALIALAGAQVPFALAAVGEQGLGILCTVLLLVLSGGAVALAVRALVLATSRRIPAALYTVAAIVVSGIALLWSIFLLIAVA